MRCLHRRHRPQCARPGLPNEQRRPSLSEDIILICLSLWAHSAAPIPYLGMICKASNYWDVFLGDISFYLVLEFVSSFSSRSYPPVRKCTDYCGMNMSTNTALKTRTRCYSFDQSLRECNGSLSINMMNKSCIIFPDRVVSTYYSCVTAAV